MKKIINCLIVSLIFCGVICFIAFAGVSWYLFSKSPEVKNEVKFQNDYFSENKKLLSNNQEPIDYVYKSDFKPDEIETDDVPLWDINSYSYVKDQITTLNTDYTMSSGITDLLYQTINSYKAYSSVYLLDLKTGASIGYNVDNIYQTASIIKAAYCLYLYKQVSLGQIDLDEQLMYTYTYFNDGTGLVKESPVGTLYTVRDLIKYTIVNSDNVAYKMLHARFGVIGYNAMLDELGIKRLHLTAYNPWGLTDLRSMAIIWQEIYHFAKESTWGEEYLNLLSNNVFNYFKNTIPNINSATKEGFTKDVTISSGILFGYHPMIVLASASASYDVTPYRQVKRLLPVINLIVNEYTEYLVKESNDN